MAISGATNALSKDALVEARISAAELSRALGVSRATISNWLSGKEPVPEARAEQIRSVLESSRNAHALPDVPPETTLRPRYLLDERRREFRKQAKRLIAAALRDRGMKPVRLAEALEVHRVNVHYWTSGKVAIPAPVAKRMGEILGLDPLLISEQAFTASVSERAVAKTP